MGRNHGKNVSNTCGVDGNDFGMVAELDKVPIIMVEPPVIGWGEGSSMKRSFLVGVT